TSAHPARRRLLIWTRGRGQTMNAKFVSPAAIAIGLVAEYECFGWHRFRHSLSTWAIYTQGNFGKALDAQRVYMEQLLRTKPGVNLMKSSNHRVGHRVGNLARRTTTGDCLNTRQSCKTASFVGWVVC